MVEKSNGIFTRQLRCAASGGPVDYSASGTSGYRLGQHQLCPESHLEQAVAACYRQPGSCQSPEDAKRNLGLEPEDSQASSIMKHFDIGTAITDGRFHV